MSPGDKRESWNRRYAAADPHATPVPNRFLVDEVGDLAPRRALDLACGAGRNAVWLAERGWMVTAVDFSTAGLAIARDLAAAHGVTVEWIEADVVTWTPAPATYDLVCVLYLQLPAQERQTVLARATEALASGGTLLVIGHDLLNLTDGRGGPREPDVLFTPDHITRELDGLAVDKAERVRRPVEVGNVLHDAIDCLVRARRP
jgi:SAM-dependent methyltransferase